MGLVEPDVAVAVTRGLCGSNQAQWVFAFRVPGSDAPVSIHF